MIVMGLQSGLRMTSSSLSTVARPGAADPDLCCQPSAVNSTQEASNKGNRMQRLVHTTGTPKNTLMLVKIANITHLTSHLNNE